ncbi:MAG: hypothetical protein EOP49_29155, partial [Sphingobacteriales bacterium]
MTEINIINPALHSLLIFQDWFLDTLKILIIYSPSIHVDIKEPLPDASLFTAQVEHRLQQGSRLRYIFLGVAGLVGGVVAAREMITVNFDLGAGSGSLTTGSVGQGIEAASFSAQSAL